jgi:hypothetical protein
MSASTQADRNGGGVVEPAARFSGPSPGEPPWAHTGPSAGDLRPPQSAPPPPEPSARAPRSRPHPAVEEAVSDEGQLFARWEKDGLAPEADEPDDDELDVLARTPEQEARRAWLLRFVALLIGFFAVIGGAALFRTKGTAPVGSVSPVLSAPPPVAKNTASAPTAPPPPPPVETPPAPPAAKRLPVVDVEIPPALDPATEQAWEWASQGLAANDFKVADKAFAELGKRNDPATRETARLARSLWWINNGKSAEVQPVIADLAANATTPAVRRRAREILKH